MTARGAWRYLSATLGPLDFHEPAVSVNGTVQGNRPRSGIHSNNFEWSEVGLIRMPDPTRIAQQPTLLGISPREMRNGRY